MYRTAQKIMKMNTSLNLNILFVGDVERGQRLQEVVESYDLKFRIQIVDLHSAQNICANCVSTLVIIDGFPEFKIARSIFYQLRHNKDVRFILLNDSPNASRYLHINALSVVKMINRDPKPNEFINAISDIVEVYQRDG